MAEALRLNRAGAAHALVLEGVSRTFGALVALDKVDLTVGAGERRGILGANGAGKTTLFTAITGDTNHAASHGSACAKLPRCQSSNPIASAAAGAIHMAAIDVGALAASGPGHEF